MKRALGYVFGRTRKQLDTFRPTQLETRDFIDYLLSAISLEKKALSPDRKAALSKILTTTKRRANLVSLISIPTSLRFSLRSAFANLR